METNLLHQLVCGIPKLLLQVQDFLERVHTSEGYRYNTVIHMWPYVLHGLCILEGFVVLLSLLLRLDFQLLQHPTLQMLPHTSTDVSPYLDSGIV